MYDGNKYVRYHLGINRPSPCGLHNEQNLGRMTHLLHVCPRITSDVALSYQLYLPRNFACGCPISISERKRGHQAYTPVNLITNLSFLRAKSSVPCICEEDATRMADTQHALKRHFAN
jgi:hypothetical protein